MDRQAIKQLVIARLSEGRMVDIVASGVSMVPMLLPGKKLRVSKCNPSELRRGDIALFDRGGDALIAHRVVANDGASVVFRGDSTLEEDGRIDYANVIGKVVGASILGRMFSICWWWGRLYGRAVLALSPMSYWINYLLARCVVILIRIKNIFRK